MRSLDAALAREYFFACHAFSEKRYPTHALDYGDIHTVMLHLKRIGSRLEDSLESPNYGYYLGHHDDGYVVGIKNFLGDDLIGCELFDTEEEMKSVWQLDQRKTMKLEIGDKVKVFTQVGLMKESKWLSGTYLDEVPEGSAMVLVSGNKIISDIRKVKKHTKLERNKDGSCLKLDRFVEQYWDQLKSLVSTGVASLLGPNPPKIEIDEEDHIISIENGWISISPGTIEKETFLEFIETPTWVTSVSCSTNGSYWEPPDVDVCDIGYNENVVNAAQNFVETIWKERTRSFWESAGEYFDYQNIF